MDKYTLKEAILKVLDDKKEPVTVTDIYHHIVASKYYDFIKYFPILVAEELK